MEEPTRRNRWERLQDQSKDWYVFSCLYISYCVLPFVIAKLLCLFVQGHAKGQWYNAWQDEDTTKGPSEGIGSRNPDAFAQLS